MVPPSPVWVQPECGLCVCHLYPRCVAWASPSMSPSALSAQSAQQPGCIREVGSRARANRARLTTAARAALPHCHALSASQQGCPSAVSAPLHEKARGFERGPLKSAHPSLSLGRTGAQCLLSLGLPHLFLWPRSFVHSVSKTEVRDWGTPWPSASRRR